MNVYETDRLLAEYLLFHYGAEQDFGQLHGLSGMHLNFPVRTVQWALQWVKNPQSVLDLGCAVGRSSLEFSASVGAVVGIDYSENFIAAAEKLRSGQPISYLRMDEGRQSTECVAVAPPGSRAERVKFLVGDAQDLPAELADFDLVHAANLICRLPEPQRFLARLPALVRPGGHLVLTTPCSWLEEFTPHHHWPAGGTLAWLQAHLGSSFCLRGTEDLPFIIREHQRKFQFGIAEASVWLRHE
jgi:putative 4-mercaptohistidine N1-methyltranferase